jgi:hypothetical protein
MSECEFIKVDGKCKEQAVDRFCKTHGSLFCPVCGKPCAVECRTVSNIGKPCRVNYCGAGACYLSHHAL